MIFNTYWFVLFTVVFFPGYWLLRWPAARGWWLLCGCAAFHTHFAGPAGVVPIAALGALTYACALSRNRLLCSGAVNGACPQSFLHTTAVKGHTNGTAHTQAEMLV